MERPPTVTVAVRISFDPITGLPRQIVYCRDLETLTQEYREGRLTDPIKCRGYYPYTHIATSPTYGPVQLRIT